MQLRSLPLNQRDDYKQQKLKFFEELIYYDKKRVDYE